MGPVDRPPPQICCVHSISVLPMIVPPKPRHRQRARSLVHTTPSACPVARGIRLGDKRSRVHRAHRLHWLSLSYERVQPGPPK
eukprot:6178865-Pleurochrysis_carterae.AAC.1